MNAGRQHIVFLQLNELNFPYIDAYTAQGYLPGFKAFFQRHGYVETQSETEHNLANPWIQWPTVHTGLDYADHGVFRLGDIVHTNHPLIYDVLEAHGLKVGAIGAFNAKNTTRDAAFFLPDPWTPTRVDGPKSLKRIFDALRQATDDYAKDTITLKSIANLLAGGLANVQLKSLPNYARETLSYLRGNKWMRAVVCDRLLADAFFTQTRRHRPDFATLFLNGGAHLQHHYLYSSAAYDGDRRNPEWHIPQGEDPLLEILKAYDQILTDAIRLTESLPNGRLVVATGLHQDPHERTTYYYRLDDHAAFLSQVGIQCESTYRLMTEDFVLEFASEESARTAEQMIHEIETVVVDDLFYIETGDSAVRSLNTGRKAFHTENRGKSIYVQLKPTARQLPKGLAVRRGNFTVANFDRLTFLAQYKNTHHDGLGYYADSAFERGELPARFPLRDLFGLFLQAFGIDSDRQARMDEALLRALRSKFGTSQGFTASPIAAAK